MKNNARIKVIGIQNDMAEDESIELHTIGSWYTKNNKNYIIYNDTEILDSSETHTRVTYDNQTVSIIRSGGTNTHLLFENGIRHIIPYETPFGLFEMVSTTKSIEVKEDETSLDLKVTYHLELNQMDMGINIFHIIAERLKNE